MANRASIKYIAIDSDILRTLTMLEILHKEHGYVKRELINDPALKKDFNYFQRLYQCVKKDEIGLVIVDAVYQESKHSESLVNFIKENCYFTNINAANYQEKAEKARNLARAYCQEYVDQGNEFKGPEIKPAPMKSVFVADINKYIPTNDCYIMAQATIEGLPLLTGNGQDFVFNKRNKNKNVHDRVRGITQINIAHGYYTDNTDGRKHTSAPILIHDLAPILRQVENFSTPEQSNDFVDASILL